MTIVMGHYGFASSFFVLPLVLLSHKSGFVEAAFSSSSPSSTLFSSILGHHRTAITTTGSRGSAICDASPFSLLPWDSRASCPCAHYHRYSYKTQLSCIAALHIPRGGSDAAAAAAAADAATAAGGVGILSTLSQRLFGSYATATATPAALFDTSLLILAITTALFKIFQRASTGQYTQKQKKLRETSTEKFRTERPKAVRTLQWKFLSVFWILRCADWLQGPYFYEVYASKIFNGQPATLNLISRLFLTGFASTALFGPWVGRATDARGRKKGTLAFALLYSLGAASTKSTILQVLLLGRVFSGIGTSLLFSAPESWLVGESQQSGDDPEGKYLGETFGLAYAGDSIVAILAGQLAGAAAGRRGPTGPFELSIAFLTIGALLTSLLWEENVADTSSNTEGKPTIREAIQVVKADPKIMLVGAVQSLFEAAMYIFVLQWPPALSAAIGRAFGDGTATPFGTVFSCFMACCLLGSTLFGQLTRMSIPTESFTGVMLGVATLAMGGATLATSSVTKPLAALVAGFFAFEACVGMYFPSIGTLRSKYVPDSHRSVIMNLFGIPLNVLVVTVFLSIKKLGVNGALSVSTGALGLATACMIKLVTMINKTAEQGGTAATGKATS